MTTTEKPVKDCPSPGQEQRDFVHSFFQGFSAGVAFMILLLIVVATGRKISRKLASKNSQDVRHSKSLTHSSQWQARRGGAVPPQPPPFTAEHIYEEWNESYREDIRSRTPNDEIIHFSTSIQETNRFPTPNQEGIRFQIPNERGYRTRTLSGEWPMQHVDISKAIETRVNINRSTSHESVNSLYYEAKLN
ncbi:hypothetical protein SK128_016223 [Halocaridina rubra]|uniref:Uncharacterized protein n=1 Tax=Halocaridina rubra TaxID=373956 RepID=A0AAN9ABB3_HALRR